MVPPLGRWKSPATAFDSHLRGPSFVMEPPPRLEFSNSSGGWLDCSASGSPQPTIDWLSVDGTSVGDVGGVRRVLRNGTLVLLPFPAAAYRQDIHSTIYRCVASNTVGRVISRDVQVRAGPPRDITSTTMTTQGSSAGIRSSD
ncbi:down syndrome cell adhesion molecule [Culex quinquefasciatus]|uniref:Down syndrome cell adhesion molecule n=1 Tax=Culex quinquefasciatus TaxID=7176 RepID=B0WIN2_CULQU|nr:down syndrome cell adhesion molecule [Culex quinquefasciatus]EDS28610.1 down syndrome cell adhesion molecule [Culex quinquefasciatus]|eukprot:XP_001848566.1 down syndrome cell adhesion molecule [Culex quinquefasciatus]